MTIVEQPLALRSFDETTPQGHVKTVFHADNPLQLKLNQTQLLAVAAAAQKDRYAWIEGKVKSILPKSLTVEYESAHKRRDIKAYEAADKKAKHWMKNNGVRILHPNNQSLHTFIEIKGKIVAEYEARLDTK